MLLRPAFPRSSCWSKSIWRADADSFFESFNANAFNQATGLKREFVQDNHSKSSRNVLRGFALPDKAATGQTGAGCAGRSFRCRRRSAQERTNFRQMGGRAFERREQTLWVPEFCTWLRRLSETTEFLYKTTDYYAPEFERSLLWNDPEVGIQWPFEGRRLCAKDAAAQAGGKCRPVFIRHMA